MNLGVDVVDPGGKIPAQPVLGGRVGALLVTTSAGSCCEFMGLVVAGVVFEVFGGKCRDVNPFRAIG